MADINKLKEMADPYTKLLEVMQDLRNEQVITNNLLCALCDGSDEAVIELRKIFKAKELQRKNDARNTKISLLVLFIACTAYYKEWIKIDSNIISVILGVG